MIANMLNQYIIGLAVFYFGYIIYVGAADDVRYKLIQNKKSWHDADADCRSRDGVLLVLDTHEKVLRFQQRMSLEPGLNVWTAAYRKHSPWLWVEGCFDEASLSRQDGVRIPLNQASECATYCYNNTYAALKGNMCYCLEDMREFNPLNSQRCDVPCPGSPEEKCGGSGTISLYSLGGVDGYKESEAESIDLEQTVHEESRADWKNCVYILKHDTPVWITTDCRKPLPFMCKIYRDGGSLIELTSPKGQVGSWTESRDKCRELGGSLADLHANNMEAVSALPAHSQYWVGLFRNTSWGWHEEHDEEKPSWCTTMAEDEVGSLRFKTNSCSIPFMYICEIGLRSALASSSNLVIYVICGTVAWILAIVTGIVVGCILKKRGCKLRRSDDGTTHIHDNFFSLEEENIRQPTRHVTRPHSYVNSHVDNTCSSSQPSCSPTKPGSSQCQEPASRTTGNEYASVCISKRLQEDQYDSIEPEVTFGACATATSCRSSTSTEGDYAHVWDSVQLGKDLKSKWASSMGQSNVPENIYAEVDKVLRVNVSARVTVENKYVTSPLNSSSTIDEFGRQRATPLTRKRSESL